MPQGSIVVSDGTNSSVVNLGGAATLADVAAAIEANPPAGRTVNVSVTPTGLDVSLDSAGGGNLSITETNGGGTAANLGILSTASSALAQLSALRSNPTVITATTPLESLFGTPAQGVVNSTAADSSFRPSQSNGTAGNGYTVAIHRRRKGASWK